MSDPVGGLVTPERRVALITGASRGIGRAVAIRLARAGHNLVIGFNADDAAATAVAQTASDLGSRAVVVRSDLAAATGADALMDAVLKSFGRIDVLVNNAGIAPVQTIDEITVGGWTEVLDTNLRSCFLLSRAAMRSMRERRWGRIVNVASQAGITGGFFVGAHYAASKGGMIAVTRTLAKVAARGQYGITVNCVAPGLIDTDLVDGFPTDAKSAMIAGIPMGRLGSPDEVASVIAFLCSDEASYVTGSIVPVDGGLLAT